MAVSPPRWVPTPLVPKICQLILEKKGQLPAVTPKPNSTFMRVPAELQSDVDLLIADYRLEQAKQRKNQILNKRNHGTSNSSN